jgi:UDP-N-acetylmuramoyl-tripeptide--D-alanyl-D-alanine ligase
VPVDLHLAGKHNVQNALGAAAAAMAAGVRLEQVARGLGRMRAVSGRLQLLAGRGGEWIVDDSYNANPSSMQAALDVLGALEGQRWFVMGDMGELGEHAEKAHREIGRYAQRCRIDRLFAIGTWSQLAVDSFGAGASWHADLEALCAAVSTALVAATERASVRVLVKGSRMNRLERVVDELASSSASSSVREGLH